MGLLAIKVLAIWSLIAVMTGFVLGAVIRKAEQLHKDEFLTALFAMLARGQAAARWDMR